MEKVTSNVFVETGFRGCNTSFVKTREGAVLIDTPEIPADAKKWAAEIAKEARLKYIINTEPHTDHAAGNCWFDGTVVTHEGTREEVAGATKEKLIDELKWMAPESLPVDEGFSYKLAEITFNKDLTIYLGDHKFKLFNMPGHTASETTVFVPEEKVVFTGDNMNLNLPIFVKSFPYEWLKSLKRIKELEADIVVPGHGEVCDKTYIDKMYDAVQYWIDSIKPAVDKGWTLEETLQKITMDDRYPGMAGNPQSGRMMKISITNLYECLKK